MTDDSNDSLLSVLCLLGLFYTNLVLKVVVEEGVDFERMLWLQMEREKERLHGRILFFI